MRPILKLVLILAVLGLALAGYFIEEKSKTWHAGASVRLDDPLPKKIENACLAYFMEYNRVPPCEDNQKLTAALLGDNSRHLAFMAVSSDRLDANKEIVDPWGTPYQIHAQGNSGVQIISAGPDRIFGTPDDIITNGVDKELNK